MTTHRFGRPACVLLAVCSGVVTTSVGATPPSGELRVIVEGPADGSRVITIRVNDMDFAEVHAETNAKKESKFPLLTRSVPADVDLVVTGASQDGMLRCTTRKVRVPADGRRFVRVTCYEREIVDGRVDTCTTKLDGSSPGFVTINSEPYADLWIGDVHVGQTPIARLQLPTGCLRLRAVSLDKSKSKTVRIEVASNMLNIYRLKL